MGICKKITSIISSKKQDIELYFKISEKQWEERLKHIDSLNEKWFRWDKIPGRDSQKLIGFLKSEFGIDWIRQEQIEQVDDKNRTATNGNKSILLKLSNDEKKVTLSVNNNILDEFIVKKDNTKLDVYYECVENIPERDLTFIIACAYAINGEEGCNSLLEILCALQPPNDYTELNPIWFEFSPHTCKDPLSGQSGKAHSTLDLAFGNICLCDDTNTEIVYKSPENGEGWIFFVEMKILADISGDSTDNPTYNQLAKYIKSSFTFQEDGAAREKRYPENIHIAIVTPRKFIEKENLHSRLYGYKIEEYVHEDRITKMKTINVNTIKSDIPKQINNEFFSKYFCWNDILNNDYEKFKEFLNHYYEKQIKDENIRKNNDTSFSVLNDQGGLVLSLKKDDNRVSLRIANKTKNLIAVNENGKLNIYFDENFVDLWNKADIDERLKKLNLHWIPYEDILDAVPQSPLKDYINRIRDTNPIFDKPSKTK